MNMLNFIALDGRLIPEEEATPSERRRAEMESLRQELHCAEEASKILQSSKRAAPEVVQWIQEHVAKIYEKICTLEVGE